VILTFGVDQLMEFPIHLGESHEQIAIGGIEETIGHIAISSAELIFSCYQSHIVRDS